MKFFLIIMLSYVQIANAQDELKEQIAPPREPAAEAKAPPVYPTISGGSNDNEGGGQVNFGGDSDYSSSSSSSDSDYSSD